jgi:hypothetical protein
MSKARILPSLIVASLALAFTVTTSAGGQATPPPAADSAQQAAAKAQATADKTQSQVDALSKSLSAQEKESDFQLSLGIGSLVLNSNASDYTNQANTLQSTSLGSATPQYLVGVSLRTNIPNFARFKRNSAFIPPPQPALPPNTHAVPPVAPAGPKKSLGWADCYPKPVDTPPEAAKPAEQAKEPPTDPKAPSGIPKTPAVETKSPAPTSYVPAECQVWRQRPWDGFISLKFSPNSSQTLSGYVIGGSYSIGSYLDVLIGFALTPVNEPSPGLRVAASQYVTAQQAIGNDLNFNPTAMLSGARNAFDGFPLTNSTGALIYKGTPLEIHYRGGVVFGISLPFSFASVFSPGQK